MTFEAPNERLITETEEFKKFSVELDYLTEFFISLAELITLNGRLISFFSVQKNFELKTELIESAAQTLKVLNIVVQLEVLQMPTH